MAKKSAVDSVLQEALVGHIINQDMAVSDIRKLLSDPKAAFLGRMTLEELVGEGKSKGGRRKAASSGAAVDTRSEAGRNAYRLSVYNFIDGKGKDGKEFVRVSAAEVREACGGTADQARKALNFLIEQEVLAWEGKAQATRYFRTKKAYKPEAEAEAA